jgi:hypothetical protein
MPQKVDRRDRPGAIIKLAIRLESLAPPKLSFLITQLDEIENIQEFIKLIDEFLPDKKPEILSKLSPTDQIATFCTLFEDRYLPLDTSFLDWEESEMESYGALLQGVPVHNLSFDVENDYHAIPTADYDDAVRLMTYLIESPWDDDGARVVIGEACAETLPREILEMVPEGGFRREDLHQYLKGTFYQAIVIWADMLWWDTGNFFFDMETTRVGCGAGYIPEPEWDREIVEDLTKEWQRAQAMIDEFVSFKKWLLEAPEKNFKKTLDFILTKARRANGKRSGHGEAES